MKDKRYYPPIKQKLKNPSTNDQIIRNALLARLYAQHATDQRVRIINELGINHGSTRADIAVVNGVMHAYEIKSDLDTLKRLPEQVASYNEVFDKVTIVVGESHLYEVINFVPDWWGIIMAKVAKDSQIKLIQIRKPELNSAQNSVSIARLLWKKEALGILDELGMASGLRSQRRGVIHQKLATSISSELLRLKVRETLFSRSAWRADQPLLRYGD